MAAVRRGAAAVGGSVVAAVVVADVRESVAEAAAVHPTWCRSAVLPWARTAAAAVPTAPKSCARAQRPPGTPLDSRWRTREDSAPNCGHGVPNFPTNGVLVVAGTRRTRVAAAARVPWIPSSRSAPTTPCGRADRLQEAVVEEAAAAVRNCCDFPCARLPGVRKAWEAHQDRTMPPRMHSPGFPCAPC